MNPIKIDDDFLAPLTEPTMYFQGQDDLTKLLLSFGLSDKDMVTTVHLVARAVEKLRYERHNPR
jgi:hypothetical protein